MENLWEKHENRRQYFSIKELNNVIQQTWHELFLEFLQNLVILIENRVFKIIKCDEKELTFLDIFFNLLLFIYP